MIIIIYFLYDAFIDVRNSLNIFNELISSSMLNKLSLIKFLWIWIVISMRKNQRFFLKYNNIYNIIDECIKNKQ